MKRFLEIALGIVTSIGGFLEIGSIGTAEQAGAEFGYRLVWAIVFGTLCLACLAEMSGRFAAVSGRTIADAMRDRFGARFFAIPLIVVTIVSLAQLAVEIGGAGVAMELLLGGTYRLWALVIAALVWLILWYQTFGRIEHATALLGLFTLVFAVAAVNVHPDFSTVARSALPAGPGGGGARYWFIAVSIVGATISPYLLYFYSAGAVEDQWDPSFVFPNRIISGIGMSFGGLLSIAVLIVAAHVFHPFGAKVRDYHDASRLLNGFFKGNGHWMFAVALLIACLGAAIEVSLAIAYFIAQGLGWRWGEDLKPTQDARFSLTYTIAIIVAAVPMVAGVEPLKLTGITMAVTAAILPLSTMPFLVIMNDSAYLGRHTNRPLGNIVVLGIGAIACVLAVVSLPLQLFGGD
jgi:Mn2+/Fe2+ NRAMP family transporter